jgi:hypothetical protein
MQHEARTGAETGIVAVQGMEAFLNSDPHPHFVYMGLSTQRIFVTGKPVYPVERTLRISGALEALMDSRYEGQVRLQTPHPDVSYRSCGETPIRPKGPRPVGAAAIPWRT